MTLYNNIVRCDAGIISTDDAPQILELDGFEVFRLRQDAQVIRVLSGCAWITVAGKDIFVPRGEDVHLMPERDVTLISSPNRRPLVFEVLAADI